MAPELLGALSVAGIAVGLLFVVLTVVGMVLLARRTRRGGPATEESRSAELRADSALLRLDDAIAASAAELEFAAAQFGTERVQPYADVLAAARRDLAEAFAIRRRLEEPTTGSGPRRREDNRRILTLSERALAGLETQERAFRALRAAEATAPERIRRARTLLAELRARAGERTRALTSLRPQHGEPALSPASSGVAAATEELARAEKSLAAAESGSSGPVTAVIDTIAAAERSLQRARSSLEGAAEAERVLERAHAELQRATATARIELEAAGASRSAAPDADSADGITRAIAEVEAVLARQLPPEARRDPVRALDELQVALGRLDTALATARNQEQRLRSAREALDGALFSARSQIAVARAALDERAGGAGARARLAEAERALELALRAADPVEALDAARRASTHARDADALARYSD